MAEFASNGKGNAALTTGIIGTALSGLLAVGGLGSNLIAPNGVARTTGVAVNSDDQYVTRHDASLDKRIAELETQVSLRDSNIYTDQKLLDVYRYFDGEVKRLDKSLCEQAVYNATNTSAVTCLSDQVAQLASLTKMVVPASNVCPTPMPLYNSWTTPSTDSTSST